MQTAVSKIEKLLSMSDAIQAFAVPGESNMIDVIHPETGHE